MLNKRRERFCVCDRGIDLNSKSIFERSIEKRKVLRLQQRYRSELQIHPSAEFFRLPEIAFLCNLMLTGQQFCEEDWSTLKKKYSSLSEDDLVRYCFSSFYIVALLHDTLGISLDDERLMWIY
ncbi:PREDICTED: probable apyrase 6 isoform X2 [Nelumbo nucifera]|uniref:Probable apyrase 6 isoform X2 n=1 Tax=Nelumbo nucifera TaxID=4432 RepID=A0A1U8APT2_NELNU|nr:PREDICTED: probable apyrase 6 isoform X2 [Nelumbo nucifera]